MNSKEIDFRIHYDIPPYAIFVLGKEIFPEKIYSKKICKLVLRAYIMMEKVLRENQEKWEKEIDDFELPEESNGEDVDAITKLLSEITQYLGTIPVISS